MDIGVPVSVHIVWPTGSPTSRVCRGHPRRTLLVGTWEGIPINMLRAYKTYDARAIPRRGSPMCACTHGTALGRGYGAHTQGEHGEVYFDAGSSSQDGLGLGRILPGVEEADVPRGMDDKACACHPSLWYGPPLRPYNVSVRKLGQSPAWAA